MDATSRRRSDEGDDDEDDEERRRRRREKRREGRLSRGDDDTRVRSFCVNYCGVSRREEMR